MNEGISEKVNSEASQESSDETIDAATARVGAELQAALDDVARAGKPRVGILVKLKSGVTEAAHADHPINIRDGKIHFQSFARGGPYPVSIDVREIIELENRGY